MRAPTSANTLRILIDDFRRFLPTLSKDRTISDFDTEFHDRLDLIDRLSMESRESRSELMRDFFDACVLLDKSDCHRRGRHKPLGYAGDYQMIDFIYQKHVAADPIGRLWDEFFHRQLAPRSVRNRKAHFVGLVHRLSSRGGEPLSILDIASGPCRDLAEAFGAMNGTKKGTVVHCVDTDERSIDYASRLLEPVKDEVEVTFAHCNALKYRPSRVYDLVWSAGLFDYLEDRYAALLLRKMWKWTQPGGSLVVGNFHRGQRGRTYMEWCGQWFLIHRSANELRALAAQAGIPADAVTIDYEPLRVCLFLTACKRALC